MQRTRWLVVSVLVLVGAVVAATTVRRRGA
jgi:hypothetical protein